MRIKTSGKIVLFIILLGAATFCVRTFMPTVWAKIMPGKDETKSVQVGQITLPADYSATVGQAPPTINIPHGDKVSSGIPIRMLVWAWNAQMGLMFSNGGPDTTVGSQMADHKINLHLERQDDGGKMQEALAKFATDLQGGNPEPTAGAHFVAIMGDGAGMFLSQLNKTLSKLGPEYQAKIVMCAGYSQGEDKFMGPADWKQNPSHAMGGVVAGVIRDGDWNIAQKWLGDNGLRNNPDEKTYDPDALNWVSANDYLDAPEKYISGFSEDLPVVQNGRRTGETKHVTVQGCVTWTPGDVNAAKKKGGLVSIVSTKEYKRQMPCTIIGIDKWMKDHRQAVEGLIAAICDGGAAVKNSPEALNKAGEISQAVYKENGADPAYWVKYYNGVREQDATGAMVDLGGSAANDQADAEFDFGIIPGSADLVAATYTAFADVVHTQYPNLMPSYPAADQIIDRSYLKSVADSRPLSGKLVAGSVENTTKPNGSKSVSGGSGFLSRRNWRIPFNTGQASFSPAARTVLEQLRRDLLIAGGASIELHGHTDNVGNADANMKLSEARAFAVQHWLESAFPKNFPSGRVQIVAEGQTHPLVQNDSEAHRAMNRRVEVILKSSQ